MDAKLGGIYQIRNHIDGKLYIGSAKSFRSRFRKHKTSLINGTHHAIKLQRSWSNYGADAFSFEPVLICSPDNLLMYEQLCMDAYDSYKSGYNSTIKANSALGIKRSKETREKIAKAKSGKALSGSHKKAISDGGKGRVKTAEERQKISLANTGKKKSPAHIEKMRQANLGKTYSDETKQKVSASLMGNSRALGNVLSDKTRKLMSEAHKGKKQDPDWIAKRIASRMATLAARKSTSK
jgi:group I intron endonuclease